MSYQPFPGQPGSQQPPYGAPPAGPAPYVQQPGAPFTPAPVKGQRRKGMLLSGIALLAIGVIGGGALIVVGGKNYEDAVKDLARAPIGCTTSLEFDKTGTFIIYAETKGSIGDVRGDCSNTGTDYSRDDVPDPDLTLTNEDGDELDLKADDGKDYDVSGYKGSSLYTVEIEDAGSYNLTVSSEDDDFAIAVGKDPKSSAMLAGAGLILLIAGGVVGLILLILGLRRRPVAVGGPDAMGPPPGAYTAPPTYATMQQPVVQPTAYPPQPNYAPPTAPMPVTPPAQGPPPAPGGWSPPPQS